MTSKTNKAYQCQPMAQTRFLSVTSLYEGEPRIVSVFTIVACLALLEGLKERLLSTPSQHSRRSVVPFSAHHCCLQPKREPKQSKYLK